MFYSVCSIHFINKVQYSAPFHLETITASIENCFFIMGNRTKIEKRTCYSLQRKNGIDIDIESSVFEIFEILLNIVQNP